ncbi:hypothetical protein GHK92_12205 [Nocardioides sp. dk4132]|uniref:hypothetical protein n=1 Tax=unclassified Nocardioides TaxID=2615069 RepID=UPI0012960D12|nr:MULTISPECIES: hypothetical protein [unclassified Nocardioides]MQW76641.1 hypothetical protein [Nocardioides sp. dk4132]QGA06994.1 hypothetical protein GFH29_06015 [Nocardioides sp. dk884]
MSDSSEQDRRAEQAFREAFTRAAATVPPAPLQVRRAPRRRWVPAMIAAAAVLLIASTAVVALRGGPGDVGPATVRPGQSNAEDPAREGPATVGTDPAVVPSPGPVPDGWRSVTFRDVSVAVPGEWGDGVAPDESWCAESGGPTGNGAYVAVDSTLLASALILCGSSAPPAPEGFGPDPEAGWRPHLRFADLARTGTEALQDGVTTYEGWTLRVRTLGTVQVALLTDAATEPVAEQVMASLTRTERSAEGCDTRSPVQASGQVSPESDGIADLRPEQVDRVALCQYLRGADGPGLMGAQVVSGEEAAGLVRAIQDSPTGVGPDSPGTCAWGVEDGGDTAVVLRPFGSAEDAGLDTGLGDIHFYFDGCAGNGFDDGSVRRQLTQDTCARIFGDPGTTDRVFWTSLSAKTARLCVPPSR